MRALIHGADRRSERLLTLFALVKAKPGALAPQLGCGINAAAMRANRAIRPPESLKMSPGGFFVIEDRIGEIDGHSAPLSCYLHRGFGLVCQVHNCRSFRLLRRRGRRNPLS